MLKPGQAVADSVRRQAGAFDGDGDGIDHKGIADEDGEGEMNVECQIRDQEGRTVKTAISKPCYSPNSAQRCSASR